jgi:hypothetical protein
MKEIVFEFFKFQKFSRLIFNILIHPSEDSSLVKFFFYFIKI